MSMALAGSIAPQHSSSRAFSSSSTGSRQFKSPSPGYTPPPTDPTPTHALQTQTQTQYWHTRALTAEALLTAQQKHNRELRAVLAGEDAKRQSAVAAVAREYERRAAGMERILYILVATVLAVLALAAYALSSARTHGPGTHKRSWAAAHFTIPILSPWTSVVEHETSVVGAKSLVGIALVVAGFLYLVVRRYLTR